MKGPQDKNHKKRTQGARKGILPSEPQEETRPPNTSGGEKGLRGSGAGTLGVPLEGSRRVGELLGSHEGLQDPFRPSGRKRGLPLRRRRGHLGTPLGLVQWKRAS